jgi:hypothetical protein
MVAARIPLPAIGSRRSDALTGLSRPLSAHVDRCDAESYGEAKGNPAGPMAGTRRYRHN